ncbi:MAG: BrnT family toxin [Beijerinckiaceae bacterium]
MIEFERVSGFDWDEGNSRKNADKHGVSQQEAEEIFFNRPMFAAQDVRHSQSERRFHLLGVTSDGRRLHVTFTFRQAGSLIRVISARNMSRAERTTYEQFT